MFRSDDERACAYATMKVLERMLAKDGVIPPGYQRDFSGSSVCVTLPPDSIVKREVGENGDGTVLKTAVQNLYGYALWAFLIQKLRKFNQWKLIRAAIIESMQEVIVRGGSNMRDEITKEYPEVAKEIEDLQRDLQIPDRTEDTPRNFKSPKLPATVTIKIK
jgi:hypothetical protein